MPEKQDDLETTLVKVAMTVSESLLTRLFGAVLRLVKRRPRRTPPGSRGRRPRRPMTLVCLLALSVAVGLAFTARYRINRYRREAGATPYVSSFAFPMRRDGTQIFESNQPKPYRHSTAKDGIDVEYTPHGGLIEPPSVTPTNPAKVTNEVTVGSSLDVLFSLKFVKSVPKGHFQFAVGAGSISGLTVQFAYDAKLKIAYVTVKQAGYYLPEGASPLEPSMQNPKAFTVPAYPKTSEFWVLVHVEKESLSVTLPNQGGSKPLTYRLVAEPELDCRTILERRSYGSKVQLKHLVIGPLDVLWSVISGRFQHEGWPELVISNKL